MIVPDDLVSTLDVVAAAVDAMREFMAYIAKMTEEKMAELGEWIDYDKPDYPLYVPVGSFRPLVIHQLYIYPSGFL